MKKMMLMSFFALFIFQGLGQMFDGAGKAISGLVPGYSTPVTTSRTAAWTQHQADYEQGNDPSAMSVTG